MWKRTVCVSLVALVAATAPARAGKFKFGILGQADKVTLGIPHPPDANLRVKTLNVRWEAASSGLPKAEQVRLQVQQALSREFTFSEESPDAVVKLSLVAYEPVRTQQYTRTESRLVKVGEKTTYDKNGKARTSDVVDYRPVPVVYWEANGSMNLSLIVADKAGVALDAFSPRPFQVSRKIILAENGVSKGSVGSLPSPDGLENEMCQQFAAQVLRRYTPTTDPVEVMLAVDSELRPGNGLAQRGQWGEALRQWESAKIKDRDNQGDQIFNLAVAKEALAYQDYLQARDLEQFMPKFKEAMDLYEKALSLDPEEKYMQSQVARLNQAKTNIEAVRTQYEVQQQEADRLAEQTRARLSQERAMVDAKNDMSPDTADEGRFRSMLRLRFAAAPSVPTAEQTADLVRLGQRTYSLTEVRSSRVVLQEVERVGQAEQRHKDYEQMFLPLIADGRLSSLERRSLVGFKRDLRLDDAEVAVVEDRYRGKFIEERTVPTAATPPKRPVPGPARVPPAPPTAPPPRVAAPTPTAPAPPAQPPAKPRTPGIGER